MTPFQDLKTPYHHYALYCDKRFPRPFYHLNILYPTISCVCPHLSPNNALLRCRSSGKYTYTTLQCPYLSPIQLTTINFNFGTGDMNYVFTQPFIELLPN